MAFRYTKPPWLTQGLASGVLLGGALLLMRSPSAETAWAAWLEATPPWAHVVLAIFVLHGVVFWGMALGFGYVDRHDRPAFIARYRIQTGKRRQPDKAQVYKVLAQNQLLWSPLMLVLLWGVLHLRGWSPQPRLPSAWEVLVDIALLTVAAAVWFYATHRLLHRPYWLKRVHKVHHEFRTTNCLAAEYAHPIEAVVGNFGTLAVGVVIFLPSLPTLYLYTVLATFTFVGHHSGYAVPWMSWAVHHDWHHFRYHEAFGTFGLLDRLFGTEKELQTLEHGEERTR